MAHAERRRWCEEISKINDKINAAEQESRRPVGVDIRELG